MLHCHLDHWIENEWFWFYNTCIKVNMHVNAEHDTESVQWPLVMCVNMDLMCWICSFKWNIGFRRSKLELEIVRKKGAVTLTFDLSIFYSVRYLLQRRVPERPSALSLLRWRNQSKKRNKSRVNKTVVWCNDSAHSCCEKHRPALVKHWEHFSSLVFFPSFLSIHGERPGLDIPPLCSLL